MQALPPALAAMAAYRQFLCYALVPSARLPGKMDKLPVSPYTGQVCSVHDPKEWVSAAEACATASVWGPGYGVAFVFTENDPLFFIDIDNAFDGVSWSPVAQRLASMFPGAAMEMSQSGKGMHIFGTGRAPVHGKKNAALGLEFYTELRFVALTGIGAQGDASTDHTAALHAITAEYFPPSAVGADGDFTLSDAPVPEWRGPTDDEDLIRRALRSKSAANVFGGRASFADLWEANAEVLAQAYPDGGGRQYDASQADAALASHLAFWTGRHGERIHALMLRSGLVRDKWHREDYLPRTISEILARPGDVLQDKAPEPAATPQAAEEAPEQREVTGHTFLSPEAQKSLFTGCVYITDRHRVLIPGGAMLKPDQFRVAFGGYVFAMDAVNERTTRNAWEAFTESQVLRAPRADTICFKPDRPAAAVITQGGQSMVNIYWPVEVPRKKGDPAPFLSHLAKIIPNENDREILICYMAACVQHQGHKFQWAPLIQGAPGNGKSLISRCVAEAIGRRYVHWPKASKLAAQFNGWMVGKTFYAVEDIHVPGSKMEIIEELKPMITGGDGLEIESKGIDQVSSDICGNFIFNCNSKTDLPKTNDDRRYAVFHSHQQSAADILRDGMGGSYFPSLYSWLREEGYAIVADFLWSYAIPSTLNPAVTAGGMLHRAPDTSSTAAAIEAGRGGVEQQIAEVIAQDTPGFMGGWVSSIMLDRLITDTLKMGGRLNLNKRRELLQGMGYIMHPGLHEGRVNNPVQPDGRKPQLYILANHPDRWLTGAAEIAKAYTAAQVVKPL